MTTLPVASTRLVTTASTRARDLAADDIVVHRGASWRIIGGVRVDETLGRDDTVFSVTVDLHRMARREEFATLVFDLDDIVTVLAPAL